MGYFVNFICVLFVIFSLCVHLNFFLIENLVCIEKYKNFFEIFFKHLVPRGYEMHEGLPVAAPTRVHQCTSTNKLH